MDFFLDNGFTPHGQSFNWNGALLWLFLVSNIIIFISFFSIPMSLLMFIRKRRDVVFSWMFALFAAFIFASGVTRLVKVWTMWHATYWLEAGLDAVTGLISLTTAILLWRLLPSVLKLPSPNQFRLAHEKIRSLAAIVESSADSIISISPAGIIMSWNRSAGDLYGYQADDVIGKPYSIVIPEDQLVGSKELFVLICRGEAANYYETQHKRKDGSLVDVSVTLSLVKDDNGHLVGVSFISRDITKYKRAQEKLKSARDQAIQASNFKSEFLASMSHEIRTPLNAVIGLSDLLARSNLSSEQRSITKTIVTSGNILLDLINNILDYSKLEADKLELEFLEFEFLCVIEEAAEILASKARDKGLSLMTYVHPDIPEFVRGDPGRIRQILINLIDNAIKFTDEGEVVVRAEYQASTDSGLFIEISVCDTGVGISPDVAQHLFCPFEQGSARISRTHGGTGLGLAISQKLVEMMGGKIGVRSEPNAGSTFWFSLPLEISIVRSEPETYSGLEDKRVLIVDGPRGSAAIMKDYFASWGLGSDYSCTWKDAEKELDTREYHFVFVDHDLGISLAPVLNKESRRELKFVLMTSSSSSSVYEAALEAGYSACLIRPIKQSQLFDCIANLSGIIDGEESSTELEPVDHTKVTSSGLILVVEDNPINQKVALLQLRDLGLAAHAVGNGKEALAATETTIYALILMDCQMPVMDGYEATRSIRKREARSGRRTPIVAMTAHAMKGDKEKCLAAGMDDYVTKPVNQEKLRRITDKWMNRADIDKYIHPILTFHQAPEEPKVSDKSSVAIDLLEKTYGSDATDEILQSFVTHMKEVLNKLENHMDGRDQRHVIEALHDIKGMSSSIFATELARFTYKLELSSREPEVDWTNLTDEVDKLKQLFYKIQSEIQSNAASGKPTDS
ncbi:MAG: response regulator [Cyanobacteria bacterium]|nr:response regulator [Cyanobacteriota bacterium]